MFNVHTVNRVKQKIGDNIGMGNENAVKKVLSNDLCQLPNSH